MNEGTGANDHRGVLRIYLGAAPGVGKTFAMLSEGRRRAERGTDVVIAVVETHGRERTAGQIGGLEIVARRTFHHRERALEEMDVDAVLARRPTLALVDELAHTNAPGSRNEKRWQDVGELLAAGIDVISTVNVQHLASLNDVVEQITGVRQAETVPDDFVRTAEQIELVDMAPEALRRRLAHGNVYPAERIDVALANYFRPGNLTALRELALLWVADQVDDSMQDYRERHGIERPWETRERVVVALAGAPGSDHLVRRAARIAQRSRGDLIGVHIVADSGLDDGDAASAATIEEQRRLLRELGGEFRQLTTNDIAIGLVDLARAENATQIVLGASARSRWQELLCGSVINRVVRRSGPIDVHVISRRTPDTDDVGSRLPVLRRVITPLPPRRQAAGWVLAAIGLPTITLAFANMRDTFGLASVLLLYLVLAMVVALVGGVFPAVVAVVVGFLLANWFFTPPYYVLDIARTENVLALVVYVAAAGIVAVLVDRVGRTRLRSARLQGEAEALVALSGAMARPESVAEILAQLRTTFGMRAAALVRRDGPGWTPIGASGADAPTTPDEADVSRELGDGIVLALAGGTLDASDERVLTAFASQVVAASEQDRLRSEAARTASLSAANELRTAILQAVSHDLRTPLASIKASISSLRQDDIDWPAATVDEFESTIEDETDRLTAIVGNLLDMSRLQANSLAVSLQPTGVEEAVLSALGSLGVLARDVAVDVPEDLPDVRADPALLERALANIVGNAQRHGASAVAVRVEAGVVRDSDGHAVHVRVVDRGRGIAPDVRELVFQPFQRQVDHQADGGGVGLGLAIARGFVEAMGARLWVEDTAGGGTTMVVALPLADEELS